MAETSCCSGLASLAVARAVAAHSAKALANTRWRAIIGSPGLARILARDAPVAVGFLQLHHLDGAVGQRVRLVVLREGRAHAILAELCQLHADDLDLDLLCPRDAA